MFGTSRFTALMGILITALVVGILAACYEAAYEVLFTPGYNPLDPASLGLLIGSNFVLGMVISLIVTALIGIVLRSNALFWFVIINMVVLSVAIVLYASNHQLTIDATAGDIFGMENEPRPLKIGVAVVYLFFIKHFWDGIVLSIFQWWMLTKVFGLTFSRSSP